MIPGHHLSRWLLLYIIFGTFLSLVSRAGASDISLTGYLETQLYGRNTDEEVFINYNKLKFSLYTKVGEKVFFETDIVWLAHQGEVELSYESLVPDHLQEKAALLPPEVIEDTYYLDNAFATIIFPRGSLMIGKQPLLQGPGYAWNPTDLLNDKDPFEPGYEKTGLNAFKLEFFPYQSSSLILTYSPEENWASSFRQLRLRQIIHPVTFHLNYSGLYFERIDILSDHYTYNFFSGDFLYSAGRVSVWGEILWSEERKKSPPDRWLVGGEYRFGNYSALSGEYYFNEWGNSNKSDYSLKDWIYSYKSNQYSLGKEYCLLSLRIEPTETITVSSQVIKNLSDGSVAVSPCFNYQFSTRALLILTAIIPSGEEHSEFVEKGLQAWARLKLFF
ncbi:hypothetical protein ACFL27_04485 [candidate division CSSED10-310 bacterium]|uniref:Uncharacterized protein n=1 Tax=candidate division CSSED10-310 bacterium TaxID=2855610 RepID=A0ABV6YTE0_UNCC1